MQRKQSGTWYKRPPAPQSHNVTLFPARVNDTLLNLLICRCLSVWYGGLYSWCFRSLFRKRIVALFQKSLFFSETWRFFVGRGKRFSARLCWFCSPISCFLPSFFAKKPLESFKKKKKDLFVKTLFPVLSGAKKLLIFFPFPSCDSVGIRTQGLLLRRQLLYPAELRNHFCGCKGKEKNTSLK